MHVAQLIRSSSARLLATAAVAVAATALTVAPAGAQTATPAATAGATGGRVATVNVNAVRGKIQELSDFRTHVQAQQSLIDGSRKGHEGQLADVQKKLASLKPDSEQFNNVLVELDEKRAQYNVSDQLMQAALLREVNQKQKKLYDQIVAGVADLAKRKGIDLVVVYNEVQLPPSVIEMNPEELNKLLGARSMLYVSDKIDLSDELATMLDAQYKAATNAAAGGTKPK